MLRPVVQYPDPLLAKVCEPVAEIDDGVRALAQDLLDTLNTVGGVGIAAPQIGVLRRVMGLFAIAMRAGRRYSWRAAAAHAWFQD